MLQSAGFYTIKESFSKLPSTVVKPGVLTAAVVVIVTVTWCSENFGIDTSASMSLAQLPDT
jgi:hypothetical protein